MRGLYATEVLPLLWRLSPRGLRAVGTRGRLAQQLRAGARCARAFAQQAPIFARAGLPGVEPQHVPGDAPTGARRAASSRRGIVAPSAPAAPRASRRAGRLPDRSAACSSRQQPRSVIGLATQHHAVAPVSASRTAATVAQAAVDDHRQCAELPLQRSARRRSAAAEPRGSLSATATQHGLAGMHDDRSQPAPRTTARRNPAAPRSRVRRSARSPPAPRARWPTTTPMRIFTVTGMLTAARIAATQSATRCRLAASDRRRRRRCAPDRSGSRSSD